MTKFYMGIDPGLTGAVALIEIEQIGHKTKRRVEHVWDIPTKERNGKNKLDGKAFLKEVPQTFKDFIITFEGVHSMPISGKAACFSFGEVFGHIQGLIDALGGVYKFLTPESWKKSVGLKTGATKDDSINIALKYFPDAKKWLTKKAHHNRAEAILIALAGFIKSEV